MFKSEMVPSKDSMNASHDGKVTSENLLDDIKYHLKQNGLLDHLGLLSTKGTSVANFTLDGHYFVLSIGTLDNAEITSVCKTEIEGQDMLKKIASDAVDVVDIKGCATRNDKRLL